MAALLARIYEVFPLICPSCQTPLTFIAFLTDPEPIPHILAHIGEPTSPPLIHPARGPAVGKQRRPPSNPSPTASIKAPRSIPLNRNLSRTTTSIRAGENSLGSPPRLSRPHSSRNPWASWAPKIAYSSKLQAVLP
jgi:hypothetical protein